MLCSVLSPFQHMNNPFQTNKQTQRLIGFTYLLKHLYLPTECAPKGSEEQGRSVVCIFCFCFCRFFDVYFVLVLGSFSESQYKAWYT